MKKKRYNDLDSLHDMLQAIADLEEIAAHGRAEFFRSRILQAAALYRFHIIAEAASRLSPELVARYPRVDWPMISGFRNLLIHQYEQVDFGIVATTMTTDVPALKLDIQGMLRDSGASDGY